jgi:predicted RNA binding protein YcfA (HicA-like mRNA interferase family)
MRVPKGLRVSELVAKLEILGYRIVRERGSHITVKTAVNGEHALRIPDKSPVAPGTLRSILKLAAEHHKLDEHEILKQLELGR